MYTSEMLLCQSPEQILSPPCKKKRFHFFFQIFQVLFFETKTSVFPQKVHSKMGPGLYSLVSH